MITQPGTPIKIATRADESGPALGDESVILDQACAHCGSTSHRTGRAAARRSRRAPAAGERRPWSGARGGGRVRRHPDQPRALPGAAADAVHPRAGGRPGAVVRPAGIRVHHSNSCTATSWAAGAEDAWVPVGRLRPAARGAQRRGGGSVAGEPPHRDRRARPPRPAAARRPGARARRRGRLGSAVVQVAAAFGNEVLAVAGGPERRQLAARAGASTVYDHASWFDAIAVPAVRT